MANVIKILSYACLGLSCSTAVLTAAGSLAEIALEKGLRRYLTQQQPVKFARPLNVRYFSSAIDDAWNTGYVPSRRHTFGMSTDNGNVFNRTNFLQTITWHFDPVRSLYYYFKDEANITVNQNTELKKPIKQDNDMVVYSLPSFTQKKSQKTAK